MRTRTLTNVKGDSVKRQKSLIMKWVKSNGYSVRGEYWDVESGSKDTMNRPEFMRMISDSERMDIWVQVYSEKSRLLIIHFRNISVISSISNSSISESSNVSFSVVSFFIPSSIFRVYGYLGDRETGDLVLRD